MHRARFGNAESRARFKQPCKHTTLACGLKSGSLHAKFRSSVSEGSVTNYRAQSSNGICICDSMIVVSAVFIRPSPNLTLTSLSQRRLVCTAQSSAAHTLKAVEELKGWGG